MLNDTQSLILCGCIIACIFITGILGVLDNFIVLTVLSIMLITFVLNIYMVTKSSENDKVDTEE
ncbi:hypothetical protein ACFFU9_14335 [Mariniflexile ostreae]|uniref:Uncharacterized protein n=1 Tax=Mariniflexile ostreae TaxID=1520892 RepID=A0ABV5FEQ5_9FLAO